MVRSRSTELSLFQLLAREWTLNDEIVQIAFNVDNTAVLFRLLSGKLALMSTKDAESSASRTRIEIDTGRTTISKRKNPIPAARVLKIDIESNLPVIRFGLQGFLVIDSVGIPHQITSRGEAIAMLEPDEYPITALCSNQAGNTLAIARQSKVSVYNTKHLDIEVEFSLDNNINCMAFSVAGDTLASWGKDCLSLTNLTDPSFSPKKFQNMGDVTQLTWNKSGSHLACASCICAFYIVDTQAETFQKVRDFPDRVASAIFSDKGNALVASGAYRLVGWSTDDLPNNDQPGTPLKSGKPGLIIINTIAAHPDRSLVAVGYANGLVTITEIGTTEEMMVHQEDSTEVNCLSWSSTGEHLAIGFKSGKAAVVTFPKRLFK